MTTNQQLAKTYDPQAVEPAIYQRWESSGAFRSKPDDSPHEETFTIVIPPPNVTGALHLGHALNNTLQDILIRYHRMRGFNTLWQPGTDHAGIATQAVVERRIRETEGKTRYQLGATEQEAREELVRRIWAWKDEYEARIISQLKLMGCSCDWDRTRFTLDDGLARAVRHMFFNLFKDGLIFRGKRLVNWDTQLQTAVSDDEVYYETVKGHFWHIKYPILPSEPRTSVRADSADSTGSDYLVIATTRPETMLGDTAVAVHPDPEAFFARKERDLKDELKSASPKERPGIEAELEALAERRQTHLPRLIQLRDMAKAGRKLLLPLVERVIPLICDEWADPTKGSGCVKITPAHDPNDYDVMQRHPEIGAINVLTADGKVARIVEQPESTVRFPDEQFRSMADAGDTNNPYSNQYEGLAFSTEGRAKVVADLEARGLLDHVEDKEIELGHSDRSKLPIEPYWSDQWFLRTGEPRTSVRADVNNESEPRTSVRAGSPIPETSRRRTIDLLSGAVLVTWTTYGTWLPGDERGYVSRTPRPDGSHDLHNLPGEPYDEDEPQVLGASTERMEGPPVWLEVDHAWCVVDSIASVTERHGIEPLAIAVMSNHVHVLCQSELAGRELLKLLKGNASRELNKSFSLGDSPRWWTRSGSTRFIKKKADLTAAIDYVQNQEAPLVVWSFDTDNDVARRFESARAESRGSRAYGDLHDDEVSESARTEVRGSLAQAAIDVVENGQIKVFPSRYAKSYLDWLGEKRDWCISRQLWWGHRIPVWGWIHSAFSLGKAELSPVNVLRDLRTPFRQAPWARLVDDEPGGDSEHYICFEADPSGEELEALRLADFTEEDDVLDTWFSSALWPFSTLGWPEETEHLKQYYPGSVLCTSRDIITNWVARMVMFGLYAMGRVPFDHVYIHPKILDGRGETMSKSKGNGVDPVDIIHTHGADALRYTMADMTTETQDIRMPVEYVCPHCGKLTDQSVALKNEEQSRKSRGIKLERKLQPSDCHRVKCANADCKKEFATQWADTAIKKELTTARETSDKFDIGRNFCNKLWNAARFAFMNLEGAPCDPISLDHLQPEDRWILARLSQTIRRYHECIAQYQFSASVKELREFFWDSLCDWYIELTKPRLTGEPRTSVRADANASDEATKRRSHKGAERSDPVKQVLAFCLDQMLRLWHPTIPFITEQLWETLNAIAPKRGLPGVESVGSLDTDRDLIHSAFPPVDGYPDLEDQQIITTFARLQDATRAVRDLRAQCDVPPKDRVAVTVVVPGDGADALRAQAHIVQHMGGIGEINVLTDAERPKNSGTVSVGGMRIYVHDISDDEAERTRTAKALKDVERQIAGKESKLNNEKFVGSAKIEVVEAERERLSALVEERRQLTQHLAQLSE